MTPLFFLHGVSGGNSAWDRQVAHFTKLGYRCTSWDQPGYGKNPAVDPYNLENVAAALRKLVGDEKAVLVGHSMGGLIAQEFYARYPESVAALALCFTSAAFVGGSEFSNQFVEQRIGPLDRGETMAQLAQRLMPAARGRISDEKGFELAVRMMAALSPETYRKAVHLLTTFDRRAELPKIAVPTLLVAGSDDTTAPARLMARMAEKIPGAELVVLDGAGHLGPMDQPERFNAALAGFLARRKL
ncbi:MAG TPA: alpha/beta fold hydrolase [Burkholderiales bacterium]